MIDRDGGDPYEHLVQLLATEMCASQIFWGHLVFGRKRKLFRVGSWGPSGSINETEVSLLLVFRCSCCFTPSFLLILVLWLRTFSGYCEGRPKVENVLRFAAIYTSLWRNMCLI